MKSLELKPIILVRCCYCFAGIMGVYALLSLINIHQYIQGLVAAKQLVITQQLFKVFITYLDNFLPHLIKAVGLFTIGYLLRIQLRTEKVELPFRKPEEGPKENDEELDAFLQDLKKS